MATNLLEVPQINSSQIMTHLMRNTLLDNRRRMKTFKKVKSVAHQMRIANRMNWTKIQKAWTMIAMEVMKNLIMDMCSVSLMMSQKRRMMEREVGRAEDIDELEAILCAQMADVHISMAVLAMFQHVLYFD